METRKRRKIINKYFFYAAMILAAALWNGQGVIINAEPPMDLAKGVDIVQMQVGENKVFPVNIPSRISILNPDIADVMDVTSSKLTIIAKAPGSTVLNFTDSYGEQSVKIRVIMEDMQELKRRVDALLADLNAPDVYAQAWNDEEKIALLGKVSSEAERGRIMLALEPLRSKVVNLIDIKEEERVVEIDVQLLELNKGYSSNLGFTWPSQVNITEVGSAAIATKGAATITSTTGTGGSATQSSFTQTTNGTRWNDFFRVLNVSRDAFTVSINALVSDGKARILSRPRLACQSGKEAELFVGGEKPILSTSVAATTGAEATNIDYKEYGIRLKINPTVTKENRIKLIVNMEISEVGTTAETLGSTTSITAKAFPFTKRSAATEVFLDDGQTLAIGGLIRQKNEEEFNEVPFLGKIPIIGAAFRNKLKRIGGGSGEKGNTELFITLTPNIVQKALGYEDLPMKDLPRDSVITQAAPDSTNNSTRNQTMNLMEYSRAVQKRILEALRYPVSAKDAGFQGTVKLRLRISYVGELMEAVVKESSGYRILDENALKAAREVGYFPPFPSSMELKDIWIDVPVVYQAK